MPSIWQRPVLLFFIGAVTFTGSIIAYLKLAARISGKPLTLPGRNILNLIMVIASIALIVWFANTEGVDAGLLPLGILTAVSLVLGLHLVMAIGGGDMPVVISMLNSYSGWAAAMVGLTLGNDLLIITGALVGSSGAYLRGSCAQGMNRSFVSVILGGFWLYGRHVFRAVPRRRKVERAHRDDSRGSRRAAAQRQGVVVARLWHGRGRAQFPVADHPQSSSSAAWT